MRRPLLPRGALLYTLGGSTRADGYDWYQVIPFDGIAPTGWVAAADLDGTPWIRPAHLACPTSPLHAQDVLDLSSFGGVVCYGSAEVELIGDVTCQLADIDRPFAGPYWLRTNRTCTFDLGGGGQALEFFDGGIEGLGLPTHGRAVVTGHFDDVLADTCVPNGELPAPDAGVVIATCRSMLVATWLEAPPLAPTIP